MYKVNFWIYEIIFLKRNRWNGSMGCGPGPLGLLIGSQHSESLSTVGFKMGD
jgi:hypothetical protein